MIVNILHADVQDFIKNFDIKKVHDLLLKNSVFEGIGNSELVQQILAYRKCAHKLPSWFSAKNILFPSVLSIEQTSSELAADLKSSWFSGSRFLDLTGGFGVDTYYFSKRFTTGVHCEIQEELSSIVQHNFEVLGINNVDFYVGNGLNYVLENKEEYDMLYLDPARRNGKDRVFKLSECTPNFLPFLEQLMLKSKKIVIKTSPLLDLTLAIKTLKYVSAIHINSVKNDCKELVFVLDRECQNNNPMLYTHVYSGNWYVLSFPISYEQKLFLQNFVSVQQYLYEPDVALTKAGWFKTIADHYRIGKLAPHTHLYTSDESKDDFLGKIFKVNDMLSFKEFKKNRFTQAHIITRNFLMKPEEIAKKYKIKEGGDIYLFFFRDEAQESKVVIAGRVK